MIKLIVFDFDDTITDNRRLDHQAFKIPSKKLSLIAPSKKKIIKFRKKDYSAEKIIRIYNKNNEKKIEKFLQIRNQFLLNIKSADFLTLKPNTKTLLNFLQKKKILCIICTTKINKKIVTKFLTNHNLKNTFFKIYSTKDLGLLLDNRSSKNRIKIKTMLINKIIKQSFLEKCEILYVGNSMEDFYAVENLKIQFVYFQNSYLKNYRLKKINTVSTMKELQSFIQDFNNQKEIIL